MCTIRIFTVCLIPFLLGACAGTQDSDNDLPVKCVDKPDPGPCKGRLKKYWYDYKTDSCRMFYYGGCGGHIPFETRDACEETCFGR
jgi:hypothetical protein